MSSAPPSSAFSLSAIAVRRHIATSMLTLAIIVVGVFFLFNLQVDLLPSITYPRIGVRIDAPGITPEVAVDEITQPLEEALAATDGVVQVYSQTREGQISLDLFFQPGGNIEQALNDTTATFNRARNRLPDTIETPRIFKFDPSQQPVYEFALTSPSLAGVNLRLFAEEELARELGVVPGVAAVVVSGAVEEEVRINIDLKRLQALNVGLTTVLDALRSRNLDIAGGRILGETNEPLTRTVGRFQNAQDIENLTFFVPGREAGSPAKQVYLRDFAKVIDGTEEERIFVTLNGQKAVKVSIQKQPDANTVQVVDGVKQRLAQLRQGGKIPPDAILTATLDDSVFIRNSLNDVVSSGLLGAFLAGIAVLLFLGSIRQTIIIMVVIPLASLSAIILMKVFGLSLNVFSLGGLALGGGIVVDNSIVMLDTIAEAIGMTPSQKTSPQLSAGKLRQQVIASSQSVESALIASTTTNLVSVLPFLMIGGFISLIFNELVLTISFAVAASLVVAAALVPMLASRWLALPPSGIARWSLFRGFNHYFEKVNRLYHRSLAHVLQHKIVVIAIALLVLGGGSAGMISQIPQEILPRINTGQATLFAQFPPGTPLERNRRLMTLVDEILLKQPETNYAFTTVGGFLFGTNINANPLRSSSTITLKPNTDVKAFVERVSKELQRLNLVDIRLRLVPGQLRGLILNNSPIRNADIDLILEGNDPAILAQAGQQVLETLGEKVPLARFRPDADARQPEVQVRPNWERVAQVGLTAQEIGETVQTALEGTIPTQLQRGNRLVDVRVKLDNRLLPDPSQLQQLPLFVTGNRQVRLSDVAQITEGEAPADIARINQRPVYLIAGNLAEGSRLSQALQAVNQIIKDIQLPEGVSFLPSAAAESSRQLQSSLVVLGGLAAFLVFVVMAVQYNSLIDPLVIMFTIPLALAGGIGGLYLTQTAISATVIVGTVLLVGIVVNNSIIMVELANQIWEKEGISRQAAILKAAPQRLRAILITTITAVLGMFPLALGLGQGTELLQPLGIVIFWGQSLATVLTLFLIPCFYVLLHEYSGVNLGGMKINPFKRRQALVQSNDTNNSKI